MGRLLLLLCAVAFCTACSEPPNKEINRAQGAIDAARAAGAEQYAPEPLAAATSALQQSRDAVEQRDYRLALARALDAGERAQEAAQQAADGKATTRSDSEALINRTTAALQHLETRLKAASAAHVSPQTLARARNVGTDATVALQKARAALRMGNYIEAGAGLKAKNEAIAAEIRELEAATEARSARASKKKR